MKCLFALVGLSAVLGKAQTGPTSVASYSDNLSTSERYHRGWCRGRGGLAGEMAAVLK